jgi:hypothetical protein
MTVRVWPAVAQVTTSHIDLSPTILAVIIEQLSNNNTFRLKADPLYVLVYYTTGLNYPLQAYKQYQNIDNVCRTVDIHFNIADKINNDIGRLSAMVVGEKVDFIMSMNYRID